MRIIFLNAWKGKTGELFSEFIRDQARSTDVFCLQEAGDIVKKVCGTHLPSHTHVSTHKQVLSHQHAENSTLSAPHMKLISSKEVFLDIANIGLGLYCEFNVEGKPLHVFNFHGSSRPANKLDDLGRLEASRGIIDFMSEKHGPKIIGGDFNLLPEAKSVRMFEESGYCDQILRNGVVTTRNHLSWDLYPDKQYYADYVFTSPEVIVQKFSILVNEVSDHLPLVIEIAT